MKPLLLLALLGLADCRCSPGMTEIRACAEACDRSGGMRRIDSMGACFCGLDWPSDGGIP